eukprot:5271836-Amphidinium_carterae.1
MTVFQIRVERCALCKAGWSHLAPEATTALDKVAGGSPATTAQGTHYCSLRHNASCGLPVSKVGRMYLEAWGPFEHHNGSINGITSS